MGNEYGEWKIEKAAREQTNRKLVGETEPAPAARSQPWSNTRLNNPSKEKETNEMSPTSYGKKGGEEGEEERRGREKREEEERREKREERRGWKIKNQSIP
jgi:hypothetical protein